MIILSPDLRSYLQPFTFIKGNRLGPFDIQTVLGEKNGLCYLYESRYHLDENWVWCYWSGRFYLRTEELALMVRMQMT